MRTGSAETVKKRSFSGQVLPTHADTTKPRFISHLGKAIVQQTGA
jgi:hypothetical protein